MLGLFLPGKDYWMELGYHLSSEEHMPNKLVSFARRAEQAGFAFALISDHYHPWSDRQGQSPFVWSVIGAIAATTEGLRLGTGVTCPMIRIHPAIIAQAAATAAAMMPGRFFLGVGAGENLNEHILGDYWPAPNIRLEMLEEAVKVIRKLWEGKEVSYYGDYYTVEKARIYTLPDELPPIYMAASGDIAARQAGRIGDGLISGTMDKDVLDSFDEGGGKGKPRFAKMDVCIAPSEEEGRKIAFDIWRNTGVKGQLNFELPTTELIEMASSMVNQEEVVKKVNCSLDPEAHLAKINKLVETGYDHIYLHQIGPNQEAFFKFYESKILPQLSEKSREARRVEMKS
jgi:G6PDH family F420-dependent oxidoreductase